MQNLVVKYNSKVSLLAEFDVKLGIFPAAYPDVCVYM